MGESFYDRDKRKPTKDWRVGPRITMDDLTHHRNGISRIPPGELHAKSPFRPIVVPVRTVVPEDDDPLGMCD